MDVFHTAFYKQGKDGFCGAIFDPQHIKDGFISRSTILVRTSVGTVVDHREDVFFSVDDL
jgi:hypothetical protein